MRPPSPIVPPDITPAHPRAVPRECVRQTLMELLGIELLPAAVDARRAKPVQTGDNLTVASIQFDNLLGDPVPAVLCLPRGRQQDAVPGVVCLPGTGSSAEEVTAEEFGQGVEREGRLAGWARELARRGFATISVTLCGGSRRRRSIEEWRALCKLLAPYGRSPVGIMVDEALRAARVLSENPGVDARRIGVMGFSLGGQTAWWSAALDPSIAAAVSLCGGLGSMAGAIHKGDPQRHGAHFYVPHLLRHFDHADIVEACIVPRPLMVLAPVEDEDMPKCGVDGFAQRIIPAYDAAGYPDNLAVIQPDDHHVFRERYFELACDWLGMKLKG